MRTSPTNKQEYKKNAPSPPATTTSTSKKILPCRLLWDNIKSIIPRVEVHHVRNVIGPQIIDSNDSLYRELAAFQEIATQITTRTEDVMIKSSNEENESVRWIRNSLIRKVQSLVASLGDHGYRILQAFDGRLYRFFKFGRYHDGHEMIPDQIESNQSNNSSKERGGARIDKEGFSNSSNVDQVQVAALMDYFISLHFNVFDMENIVPQLHESFEDEKKALHEKIIIIRENIASEEMRYNSWRYMFGKETAGSSMIALEKIHQRLEEVKWQKGLREGVIQDENRNPSKPCSRSIRLLKPMPHSTIDMLGSTRNFSRNEFPPASAGWNANIQSQEFDDKSSMLEKLRSENACASSSSNKITSKKRLNFQEARKIAQFHESLDADDLKHFM